MSKPTAIIVILFLASPLFSVEWKDSDWDDPAFMKHYFVGIITTEFGWEIASLFLDKSITKIRIDENGWHHTEKISVENHKHFAPKVCAGILTTVLVMRCTNQEWEPDGRAMNIGCYHWLGFKTLLHIIKIAKG